jgi:alpha-tubulin suppressor-like RCC1 family protein
MPSGYKFPILNSTGSASSTMVDFDDMFVSKELFLDAGLYVWGNSVFGQLGNSSTGINYSSPIQVGAQTNWRSVIPSGGSAVSAVKVDGSLWTWGGAGNGELGNNTTTAVSSPIQVGSLYNWKQTACDEDSSIWAIKTDGTLWAWGRNTSGQLGNGNRTSYSSPIQIGSLTNWKQIAGNGGNSNASNCALAVKTDGTLWAWGGNATGQLGTNNTTYYSSPIQVGALTNWKYVAGNSSSQGASNNAAGVSYGIKTDGTLWSWGYSPFGIGNGSLGYYSSPIQIGSLTNWKQVSTSWGATLAVKTDGTLWSWGNNNYGQLGNNNRAYYSSPIQIGSLTNWKQVSCGATCVAAIKTDGTLWVWGANMYTQLGLGYATTSLYYSSPIQVGALTSWKSVKASFYGIQAISSPDLP